MGAGAVITWRTSTVAAMIKLLFDKRLILVKAPPFSGKTGLAQLVMNSLKSKRKVIYLNFRDRVHGQTFSTFWKTRTGTVWSDILHDTLLMSIILDEVQTVYAKGNENEQLWAVVKSLLFGAYPIIYLVSCLFSMCDFDCILDMKTCQL
jgi:predicted AAA+ superfamily ATPase